MPRAAKPKQPDRLMTVPDAARAVGLHPDVLWRRLRCGAMRAVTLGKRGRGHVTRIRLRDAQAVADAMRALEAETVSTGEAAARLGVSPGYLRRLVREGELPATRRGLAWRVRVADLDRYLASRTREPRP